MISPDRRLRRAWVVLGVVSVAIAADVLLGGPLAHLDQDVRRHWFAPVGGRWRPVLESLTVFGQWKAVVTVVAIVAAVAARRRRARRPLVVAAAVVTVSAVATWSVKYVVGRSAPSQGDGSPFVGAMSFPSGHAANAVVLWGLAVECLALWSPSMEARLSPRRRAGVVAVAGLAAGGAMVALGNHWCSDVLGGWAIGGWMLVTVLLVDPFGDGRRGPARLGCEDDGQARRDAAQASLASANWRRRSSIWKGRSSTAPGPH